MKSNSVAETGLDLVEFGVSSAACSAGDGSACVAAAKAAMDIRMGPSFEGDAAFVGLASRRGTTSRVVIDYVQIVTVDVTPPVAQFMEVAPDPRFKTVDEVTLTFDEPVSGLDLSDLSLTRDGGNHLLPGPAVLTTSDNVTWALQNMSELTDRPGN